ncbi:MAG: HPP family protein [Dehalococcoidia bacterium]|nr:HPP family protein [Dehalococcoidia bacterium]
MSQPAPRSYLQQAFRGGMEAAAVLWAPVGVAVVLGLVGLAGALSGRPWLFPSLAPSAFMQVKAPRRRESGFYNVVVGQFLGFGSAVAAIYLFELARRPMLDGPSVHITAATVASVVVAVLLTELLEVLLNASHPPGGAMALVIILGGYRLTATDTLSIVAGVLLVGVIGETARRLRVLQLDRIGATPR